MRQSTGTRAARGYAGTMAGFWSGLSGTLRALDAIAADRTGSDEDALGAAPTLQYRLHWSSELLAGVQPPAGREGRARRAADALADARDATGEIAEALESGAQDAAAELLFEWRGALFRVRLARMRLGEQPAAARGGRAGTAAFPCRRGHGARRARRGRVPRRRRARAGRYGRPGIALVAAGSSCTVRNQGPLPSRSYFEVRNVGEEAAKLEHPAPAADSPLPAARLAGVPACPRSAGAA